MRRSNCLIPANMGMQSCAHLNKEREDWVEADSITGVGAAVLRVDGGLEGEADAEDKVDDIAGQHAHVEHQKHDCAVVPVACNPRKNLNPIGPC